MIQTESIYLGVWETDSDSGVSNFRSTYKCLGGNILPFVATKRIVKVGGMGEFCEMQLYLNI